MFMFAFSHVLKFVRRSILVVRQRITIQNRNINIHEMPQRICNRQRNHGFVLFRMTYFTDGLYSYFIEFRTYPSSLLHSIRLNKQR